MLLLNFITVIHFSTFFIQTLVVKFFRLWVSFTFWPLFSISWKFQTFFQSLTVTYHSSDQYHFWADSERPFLHRNRSSHTYVELWRTCGELWLYFKMQRRLDLWSFSWLSRHSREAKHQLSFPLWISRSISVPIPAGKFERVLGRRFSVDFQTEYIVGKILSWSKQACFFCESDKKRPNGGRSKFAGALISRMIKD